MRWWVGVLGVLPFMAWAQSSDLEQMWRDLEDMWYRNKVYQGQLVNARSSVSDGVNAYSRSV